MKKEALIESMTKEATKKPKIKKFEYTRIGFGNTTSIQILNDMGLIRWELVCIEEPFAYFKREIQQ